jgi:hypothetical protein
MGSRTTRYLAGRRLLLVKLDRELLDRGLAGTLGREHAVSKEHVVTWIAAYERAWRVPGTDGLAGILTADATYQRGAYEHPVIGLAAIARMWEAERDGPDEAFTMASELVAVDGDTAVARVEVHTGEPLNQQYRDLRIVRFAPPSRCA